MARDYVGYLTADYVRGTVTDHIIVATPVSFCHHCGETVMVTREGCHLWCQKCGSVSEGCGD